MTTTRTKKKLRSAPPIALGAGLSLLLAACGSSDDGVSADAGEAGADSSLGVADAEDAGSDDAAGGEGQDLLPEEVREAGKVVVAINPEGPPIKFLDEEQELDGVIVDLIDESTARLGVEVEYAQTTFDGLIPGVMSDRFDMIASIGDYAERHDQLDLVDYMVKGVSIIVPSGNPDDVSDPADLCGLSVTFVRGIYAGELAEQTSAECEANGEDPIRMMPLESSAATEMALQSGQADAEWGDSPEAAYRSEVLPDLYEVAHFEEVGPYGIGFPKDAEDLREAYRTVLLEMAEDGTFEEIMAEWGLAENRWEDFPINQGPAQS